MNDTQFSESEDKSEIEKKVHQLYEDLPYPASDEAVMTAGAELPPLGLISRFCPNVLLNDSKARILVAGCGSGAEAFRYSLACPKSTVVGLDFSDRAIAVARTVAEKQQVHRISFSVADLSKSDWIDDHEPFDFISLHGVIDYIPDAGAAFSNLAKVLKPGGVLYAGVNGPGHPNLRYRRAIPHFEMQEDQTVYSEDDRDRLRAIERLMMVRRGESVSDERDEYLASDVFTSQNHSKEISEWLKWTAEAGLHLIMTIDLPFLVPNCPPKILRHYLKHDREKLSRISSDIQEKSFMRMLLTNEKIAEPPWSDVNALSQWTPYASAAVRERLPSLDGDWNELRHTTPQQLKWHSGLFLSPAICEFVKACDGTKTALEIWAGLPEPANWETLVLGLFATFHAGMVSWKPPAVS